jgi:aryl-alcohol dehydrogenase-like predicted oxidoreductase
MDHVTIAVMVRKRRLGRTGLEVSEISLGTVELGMAYGIGASKPNEHEAAALLHGALDLGINLLDTARAYGDAEVVIGRNLAHRRNEYILLSKVAAGGPNKVRDMVEQSLRELRTDRIDIMLVHCGSGAVPDADTIGALLVCKGAGKLRYIGASVYGEQPAVDSIEAEWCDCIEIAYSALDRRPEATTLQRAAARDTGVIARSVLLKGALTARSSALPREFQPLTQEVDRVVAATSDNAGDLPNYAYRYVLGHPAIASALVGTSKIGELEAAVRAAKDGPLDAGTMGRIRALPCLGEEWLNPGRWPAVETVC